MIRILRAGEVKNEEIFARNEPTSQIEDIVADIIANVREKGDQALKDYTLKFDKADLKDLAVSEEEIAEALSLVEPAFLEIVKEAAVNIRSFHEKQKRTSFIYLELVIMADSLSAHLPVRLR